MLSSAFRSSVLKRTVGPRNPPFLIPVPTSPRSTNQAATFSRNSKGRNDPSTPSLLSDIPSQTRSAPYQESPVRNDLYDHWLCFWEAMEKAGPGSAVARQVVRCHGPLYRVRRVELDENPQIAKKQWHEMCVAYELKHENAMTLYEENKTLRHEKKLAESEKDCAEETVRILQDTLERLYEAVEKLGQENYKLNRELQRIDAIRCDV
ncbi:hypothetical protein F5Y03DRAFT_279996 [Xylaria venustula]|nr:hypothetical protein F5Y03DRAFT_279996 [Xylaria venustula]